MTAVKEKALRRDDIVHRPFAAFSLWQVAMVVAVRFHALIDVRDDVFRSRNGTTHNDDVEL